MEENYVMPDEDPSSMWKILRKDVVFWVAIVGAVLCILVLIYWRTPVGTVTPGHSLSAHLSTGPCNDEGTMWTATLTVDSDVAGGTAHINDPGSPWQTAIPVHHVYNVGKDNATWTVVVYGTWPDGFQSPTQTLTAKRPADGCTPVTTATPTTTDCAHAIPPRTDCGGTTTTTSPAPTVEPTTTVPDSPTTSAPPASSVPATTAPVPSPRRAPSTTTPHLALPPTR